MANKILNKKWAEGKFEVDVDGSFQCNSTSAPLLPLGVSWAAARTGVGTYTVTFTYPYVNLLAVFANLQLSAVADAKVQVLTWVAATRVLTLQVVKSSDGVTAVEIAANANNRISFLATFQQSAVLK